LLLGDRPAIQTLTKAEDFKRAMAQPWLAKSPHFAVHHLSEGVQARRPASAAPGLSSGAQAVNHKAVDNSFENPVDKCLDKLAQAAWAGYVVPKRHARRAVTRNLIRRQMRQVLIDQQRQHSGLPSGIWVLRLRLGFDKALFPSAASNPLKQAVREELRQLMVTAMRRLQERTARA
jgi:ribonuclease P protein component